jgi:hypothetical protein
MKVGHILCDVLLEKGEAGCGMHGIVVPQHREWEWNESGAYFV